MLNLSYAIKKFLFPIIRPLSNWYLERSHSYQWNGIKVAVLPGVFNPALSLSTSFLLSYIKEQNLRGKMFLELGAGCGLMSVFAAKKGADVMASDISRKSVVNTLTNMQLNEVEFSVIRSDLFDHIPAYLFDYIAINPPCYPHAPLIESDYELYCGENFEFFQKLFSQLPSYLHEDSIVWMILPTDSDIKQVRYIAATCSFQLKEVMVKRSWGEKYIIFEARLVDYG